MNNIMQNPVPVESRIAEVTVYLSGAQVTRVAEIPEGAEKVVFGRLPEGLHEESIQASAGGGVSIRAVEHDINYMLETDYTSEITELQAKLEELERERLRESNKIELGELEEAILAENRKLAGKEASLKAEDLKAVVMFYNERMAAIRETRMACKERIKELDLEIANVKAQLGGFDRDGAEPVSEITVTVAMETGGAGGTGDAGDGHDVPRRELAVSYFVYSAGWRPSYDIRAKDTSGNILLHYKASVSQSTGENWEDVKLSLSTGNPSIGGVCPEMKPWYLDFYDETPKRARYRTESFLKRMVADEDEEPRTLAFADGVAADGMDEQMIESLEFDGDGSYGGGMGLRAFGSFGSFDPPAPPPSVITESMTSVEYAITAPCTVASGDGGQDVEIAAHSLPAEFRYFSASKLEREVFLLAAIGGWERLNLVEGEASIFFENRYVGKSYIDPRKGEEKIDLSLGADKSVLVTRVRGKDFTAKALVGGNVKQTRQWELTARNLKPAPIDIEMLDQIPVSANKQITVDAVDISGAEIDKDTGILTWKFALKPAESKSLTVKYAVTSPKNKTVVLE